MDIRAGQDAIVRRDEFASELESAIIDVLDAGVSQEFVRVLAYDDAVAFSDVQRSCFCARLQSAELERLSRGRAAAAPAVVLGKRMGAVISSLSHPGPRCAGEAWMESPRLPPMVGAASSVAVSSSSTSMDPYDGGVCRVIASDDDWTFGL